MKTNFKRLKSDLLSFFTDDKMTPKPILFLVFMIPAGMLLADPTTNENPIRMIAMYIVGGVTAWILTRGSIEDKPAKDELDHRMVLEGIAPFATLVLRDHGGKVTFRSGEVRAAMSVMALTTRHPDGSFTVEFRPVARYGDGAVIHERKKP